MWGTFGADLPDRLYESIGEALVSFLWTDRRRRLVTKSPSVTHLERFFTFFPQARLLILVRDGRSVTQSAMDTFGWHFERASRTWSDAAATVHRFRHAESSRAGRWRVVRYEDLLDDSERQLRAIFDFLDLDAALYDFDAARTLPVRGSSAFGRTGNHVHWDAVPKDASFAPKERWRSWSAARLERFDWLAGEQLVHFGYADRRRRFTRARSAKHVLRDWQWHMTVTARQVIYRARVRLALRSRIVGALKGLRVRPGAR
jgi:hypothetical protein